MTKTKRIEIILTIIFGVTGLLFLGGCEPQTNGEQVFESRGSNITDGKAMIYEEDGNIEQPEDLENKQNEEKKEKIYYDDYGNVERVIYGIFNRSGELQEGEVNITYYYENGNIKEVMEGTFKDGYMKGVKITTYYENGNILYVGEREFYAFEKLSGEGTGTYYYKNGNKMSVIEVALNTFGEFTGEGKVTFYYENGNVKRVEEGTFKNGFLRGEGKVKVYWENGNIQKVIEGTLRSGVLYKRGDGKGTVYDEDGNIISSGEYRKGILINEINYQ